MSADGCIVQVSKMSRARRKPQRASPNVRKPDAADREIGRKIRTLRLERKMTQKQLANAVGVTFQMVRNYERAFNRIGAGRLWRIAEALKVSPLHFFPVEHEANSARPPLKLLANKEALRLLKAFARISDADVRRSIVVVAEHLSPGRRPLRLTQAAAKLQAAVMPVIIEIQTAGVTSRQAIANELNRRGIKTVRGREWTGVQVRSLIDRHQLNPSL